MVIGIERVNLEFENKTNISFVRIRREEKIRKRKYGNTGDEPDRDDFLLLVGCQYGTGVDDHNSPHDRSTQLRHFLLSHLAWF